MAFSMSSEIERDLISPRTKEALRYKKEQGIKLGRPIGSGSPEIEALMQNASTQKFIAGRYGTTEGIWTIGSRKTVSSMKTVSVSSRKTANFEPSASKSEDYLFTYLLDN